jgi:hypothetical protein
MIAIVRYRARCWCCNAHSLHVTHERNHTVAVLYIEALGATFRGQWSKWHLCMPVWCGCTLPVCWVNHQAQHEFALGLQKPFELSVNCGLADCAAAGQPFCSCENDSVKCPGMGIRVLVPAGKGGFSAGLWHAAQVHLPGCICVQVLKNAIGLLWGECMQSECIADRVPAERLAPASQSPTNPAVFGVSHQS